MTTKPISCATSQGSRGEIITRSSLPAKFVWPAGDPRLMRQASRTRTDADWELIGCASRTPYLERDVRRFNARLAQPDEAVLRLLNHWAFQFNSRRRFRECEIWSRHVRNAIRANRAIEIMIPAFCVIANPIKRIDGHAITTAEDVSLLHLANLAEIVAEIYQPGLVIHIVSDSNFYALPLGLTAVEAQRYFQQLRHRVSELQIDESIKVHDMVDLLLDQAPLFRERFVYWRAIYLQNPLCDGISELEYKRWQFSMRNSINTYKFGLDYSELARYFEPTSAPQFDDSERHALVALAEYRAMKAAAADTGWEHRHFPNAIRASIHTKMSPVLGLRLYPEYKMRSTLLPYHGVALLEPGRTPGSTMMRVVHELTVVGNPAYTRVLDAGSGHTAFYEPSNTPGPTPAA